ncbi:MAG: tryptophan synthase subunit alpha [Phycisphaeraceae bacterium]
MNRIDAIFQGLRHLTPPRARKGALMPFITAGDPDLATTAALLPALQDAGAAVCELGFPFSDPIADGPVIQESMTRALARGVRTADIFAMVKAQRQRLSMGLVAMVSYSIVFRHGPRQFAQRAAEAGFDGLILPDLPVEESDEACRAAADAGLTCTFLIAPNTPMKRAEQIARACTGFVYVLARAGVTGERAQLPADLPDRLARLRQVSDLPMAVGFGIADAGQAAQVLAVADAVIVGSAVVRRINHYRDQGPQEIARHVAAFVAELAGARTVT